MVGLILLSIGFYIATLIFKQNSKNAYWSFLAGTAVSIVITIINFIYRKLILYFANYVENHKYQHTYENSIVNKIFLFSFVNSNVGLCYTAFYWKSFDDLYWNLFGMVFTKVISGTLVNFILPVIIFRIKKFCYFRKVKAKAMH